MDPPLTLTEGDSSSGHSVTQVKMSDSPVVSCFSSDDPVAIPLAFEDGESSFRDSLTHVRRSDSPVASCVSMKSDVSMELPLTFKDGDPSPGHSVSQLKRPASLLPSCVSMKSDVSMELPLTFKDVEPSFCDRRCGGAPTAMNLLWEGPACKRYRKTQKNRITDPCCEPSSDGTDLRERCKLNLLKKFQHVYEEKPSLLNDIYTELYITKGDSGNVNNEHEVRQTEAASRRAATEETPIKCRDIFKPLSEEDKPIRSVLTKGVAGIGKTVSVQKFILDWAERKTNQDVHLIFPLPFRELNLMTGQTPSLIKLLHFSFKEIKETNISSLHKVLFIFDGLDECRFPLDFQNTVRVCDVTESASVNVLLINLIKGNLLPSALIWITSRPAAADQIPSEWLNRVTEVRGFNDPQKDEYFRKRIKDQRLSNRIVTHLKSLRSLYIMCHIPVFCWISASVLERLLGEAESGEIPKTLTQMYTHFLIIQTNIIKKKYTESREADKEMVLKLGNLAFKQLMKGNLIFYEEDLMECGIDVTEASVYSGMCTQIFREEFGLHQSKVYCFVHLTIQEHLAALYVHLTFMNEKRNVLQCSSAFFSLQSILSKIWALFKEITISDVHKSAVDQALHSENGLLDLFLRFLLGLSMDSNQILLQTLWRQSRSSSHRNQETVHYIKEKIRENPSTEKSINLFHCLNELEDHSLVKEIQRYLQSEDFQQIELSSSQWSAVVFVLLASVQEKDVFVLNKYKNKNHTSDNVLLKLLPVVAASRKAEFNNCGLTEKSFAALASVLSSEYSNLRELDLSENNLEDTGVKSLSAVLEKSHCKLKTLRLCNCGISDEGCAALTSALSSNPSHLRELALSWNYIRDSGVKSLSAVLENPLCKLETLRLKSCGVTAEGCAALTSALRSNPSHLRELDLSLNILRDSGGKSLSAILENPHCILETLNLFDCEIFNEDCVALTTALSSNPSHLRKLDLSWNICTYYAVKSLSAVLGNPQCKMESLRMRGCGVSDEGCVALMSALSSNPSHLKELDLTWNKIRDSGVKSLSAVLENPHCEMETMWLCDCGVTDEGCAALKSALSSNPSHLRELDLSWNKFGDSGVKQLSVLLENPHCKLETLRLQYCDILGDGCAALASALRSNPSHLRKLDLSNNKLGDPGVKSLSAGLEYPHCKLETLKLCVCDISDESCAVLTSALNSNPSHLRELDLSWNEINDSGAKTLCSVLENPHSKLKELSKRLWKERLNAMTAYLKRENQKVTLKGFLGHKSTRPSTNQSDSMRAVIKMYNALEPLDGSLILETTPRCCYKVNIQIVSKLAHKVDGVDRDPYTSTPAPKKELMVSSNVPLQAYVLELGNSYGSITIGDELCFSMKNECHGSSSYTNRGRHFIWTQASGGTPEPNGLMFLVEKSLPEPVHDQLVHHLNRCQNVTKQYAVRVTQIRRPDSPLPSCVSMKSDMSMDPPLVFKDDKPSPGNSVTQVKRSDTLLPSCVSMKTDMSMDPPLVFKDGEFSSGNSVLQRNGSRKDEKIKDPGLKDVTTESQLQKRCRSNLLKKFQHMYVVITNQGNPTLLNEIYTELYITEGNRGKVNNEHESKQIEAASRRAATEETPIKCSDIFKPLSGEDKPVRSVLTKGVAGIGKTVSVQKFILDWAERKTNQDVHLIFPLPFRELNLIKDQTLSLMELLHFYFKEIKETNISSLHKVLFIFDGLDECRFPLDFQNTVRVCDVTESASVNVLLINLIKGNLLPSALIWITSRPAAADQIPSEWLNRVTEVQGFNDPQKEEYFRKRIRDQSLSNRIVTHLKSLKSLYIMCHIPVFCWISATVLERLLCEAGSGEMPKTLTQMYTHFLIIQTNIIKKKYTESREADKEMVLKLGNLAFKQLMKGNLIFYEEDLMECGIDVTEASVYSGVCTQIFREEFGLHQSKVYCFVHLTIQEHLAALYVHLTFMNEKRNVFKKTTNLLNLKFTISDVHKSAVDQALQNENGLLDLFLRFLLGLSLKSNQILLQTIVSHRTRKSQSNQKTVHYIKEKIRENPSTEKSINLFHCLNELEDHSLVEEIQNYLQSGNFQQTELSPSQWSAVVFVLLTSVQEQDVFVLNKYINKHHKSDDVLLKLLPVVAASRKAEFKNCDLNEESCAALVSVLSSESSNLRELDLSENKLGDSGVKRLSAVLENPHCKLETLRLCDCCASEEGCAVLISALRSNPSHLRELALSENKVRDSGVKSLSDVLKNPHCKLETLRLCNCCVSDEGCAALTSALRSNPSHLRELNLSENNLGDFGIKSLTAVLENPHCNLETLRLCNCGVSDEGCAALNSALTSNPSHLRELDLSGNNLRDSGVKSLSAVLENPHCKLEKLRLSYCLVTAEGCAALTSTLRLQPSHLRELDLSKNNIGDSEVKSLSAVLENPDCKLETLRLCNCKITDEGCAALTSALRSNPSHLKELDLSENKLRDSGIKSLSAVLENPLCELKTLRLCICEISEEGCAALTSALRSNPSHLRELDLSRNKLRDSGVRSLSAVLKNPDCKLETLRLRNCEISDEGCAALISALSSNPSHLRELDLAVNDVKDSVVNQLFSLKLQNLKL
ncbi:uncharacterized protein LOC113637266 [Tachysurus fulvidraco]|uniref:uncharacterized protein LOC113637266 n=1 Tax=Tachysurus fulvidraco TaxID=1234273 RepID=UPI001FEE1F87|nr:uncharacterized protein LOC113637266 [Tachysurus fulvidraco]